MKANVGGELENPVCASLDPAYCPWLDWMEQAETGFKWDKCENAGWYNNGKVGFGLLKGHNNVSGWNKQKQVSNGKKVVGMMGRQIAGTMVSTR